MARAKQRGAVLIVSLLLLTAMTLLGVAAINSSTVNLLIVGNLQAQQEAEAASQEAVEAVLSSVTAFGPNASSFPQPISGDRVAQIDRVECRSNEVADGYSATLEIVPEDNTWHVSASYATADGGLSRLHQGVRIRQTMGMCPEGEPEEEDEP